LESPAALSAIAVWAGAHQVFPIVLASVVAWDNVVYGQVLGLMTTVLAGVVISSENLFLSELNPGAGPPDYGGQLYHRRAQKGSGGGADDSAAILQDLGLTHHDQVHGPLDVADVERFVV
jgi:hypothetical protein